MDFKGNDKWRNHPLISNGPRYMFPGLRNAAVLFAGYVVVDQMYGLLNADSGHHHHDDGHSSWQTKTGERPSSVKEDKQHH